MFHCPFCGKKIASDAPECKHCGKTIGKNKSDEDAVKLTNLDTWENKRVPAWVMYAVVVVSLIVLGLLIYRGCEVEPKRKDDVSERKTINEFEFALADKFGQTDQLIATEA